MKPLAIKAQLDALWGALKIFHLEAILSACQLFSSLHFLLLGLLAYKHCLGFLRVHLFLLLIPCLKPQSLYNSNQL